MNQLIFFKLQTSDTFQNFKILYTNADCFTLSKREELNVIIQESSPDIIGITEVFPKNKLFDNQEIFYQIDNLLTANLQEGRGVILYVKSDLFAEQAYFESDFQEAVWCRVKLKNRDTLLVGCIYRRPNSTEANFQHLKTLMSCCRDTHYTNKLLMGDFNFKEINWCEMTTSVNETHISSQFLECVRDTYFFQHKLNPTHNAVKETSHQFWT